MSGLLVARLCHDLAGGIGAIAGAAEMLRVEDDLGARDELAEMIGAGAGRLSHKLRFYRMALGASTVETLPVAEVEAVVTAFFAAEGRLSAQWALEGRVMPTRYARLLAVCALVAGEAVHGRGVVRIAQGEVSAQGRGAALGSAVAAALAGAGPGAEPSAAPAHVAAVLAAACGLRLRAETEPTTVRIALEGG